MRNIRIARLMFKNEKNLNKSIDICIKMIEESVFEVDGPLGPAKAYSLFRK